MHNQNASKSSLNSQHLPSLLAQLPVQQRVSVDSYRVAYEAAHQLNHSAARGRDEYGSRVAVDDLETIKVTVKEPSVAFRYVNQINMHRLPQSS